MNNEKTIRIYVMDPPLKDGTSHMAQHHYEYGTDQSFQQALEGKKAS